LVFGGTFQFTASVDADAGIANKTVTWKTGDATIATVDATGKVTASATKAGQVSVIATSAADASVSGAAVVTVGPAAGAGGVVTVSISTINGTVCVPLGACTSVPANVQNFGTAGVPATTGQLDVTLNVDAGGQVLKTVSATLKCGNDSIVQTETITSSSVAPLSASDAAAPVTLSFNTVALNASNVPLLHNNAACTLSASAVTAGGTQSATSTQTLTLNNADVSIVTVATTAEATDPNNAPWVGGGPLTVTALPVMYSGRTAVSAAIGLAGGLTTAPACPGLAGQCNPGLPGAQVINTPTAGAFVATWTNGPTAPSVQGLAVKGTSPTAVITDNSGAVFGGILKVTVTATSPAYTNTPVGPAFAFNFDDQKPAPGAFSVLNNPDQNIVPPAAQGYVGTAFRFAADSAAGFRGANAAAGSQTANFDFGAVDKVTTIFQFRVTGSGSAYTTVTNTSTIGESVSSATYQLRWITADALGNADTTGAASSPQATITFGVDKTPPVNTPAAAPANLQTNSVAGGNGNYTFVITDNLSGPGAALVAQVRNWNGLSSVNGGNEGRINTNVPNTPPFTGFTGVGTSATGTQQPCYIGRFNATAAASGPNAIAVFSASGAALGFCTPVVYNLAGGAVSSDFGGVDGYWTTTVVAADVAANQAAPVTRTVLQDVTAPTIANIDPPPTATGNATVGFPATVTDNAGASVGDIIASWIAESFTGVFPGGPAFRFPNTTGPGVAFDNVLTNSTVVTPIIPNFMKNLQLNDGASAALAPVAAGNATGVTITAQGAALNTGSAATVFTAQTPQFINGTSPVVTWPNGLTAGFNLAANNLTVSNCPLAGCTGGAAPANPTTITLTATAKGATATFANPLVGGVVGVWYRLTGTNPFFFAGNAAAGVSRDDGVNRFWDYVFTFDPPVTAPDGTVLTSGQTIEIVLVGINANGDGIMTPSKQIQLTNP
jgi:hypothetical protein